MSVIKESSPELHLDPPHFSELQSGLEDQIRNGDFAYIAVSKGHTSGKPDTRVTLYERQSPDSRPGLSKSVRNAGFFLEAMGEVSPELGLGYTIVPDPHCTLEELRQKREFENAGTTRITTRLETLP